MRHRYEQLGRGPQRRLARSAASASSACRSRVWYPLDADGEPRYDDPLVPDERPLPIDPSTDVPDGFTDDQRGVPGGFIGDPDVMDTWATSSLTPQIAGGWEDDPATCSSASSRWTCARRATTSSAPGCSPRRAQPLRARLAAVEARRTVSGWILDPDRKKMSKSKGNVVTPMRLLDQYGTDAVRYWAASRPARRRHRVRRGADEGRPQAGQQAAQRRKFVLGFGEPPTTAPTRVTDAVDLVDARPARRRRRRGHDGVRGVRLRPRARAHRGVLLVVLRRLRRAGEGPRLRTDGDGRRAASAKPALRTALEHACSACSRRSCRSSTDEVWSWWHDGSVHALPWPDRPATPTAAISSSTPVGEVLAPSAARRPRPRPASGPRSRARRPARRPTARRAAPPAPTCATPVRSPICARRRRRSLTRRSRSPLRRLNNRDSRRLRRWHSPPASDGSRGQQRRRRHRRCRDARHTELARRARSRAGNALPSFRLDHAATTSLSGPAMPRLPPSTRRRSRATSPPPSSPLRSSRHHHRRRAIRPRTRVRSGRSTSWPARRHPQPGSTSGVGAAGSSTPADGRSRHRNACPTSPIRRRLRDGRRRRTHGSSPRQPARPAGTFPAGRSRGAELPRSPAPTTPASTRTRRRAGLRRSEPASATAATRS